MIRTLVATALVLSAAAPALAGYSLDVKKAPDFPAGIGTIAVLPASCPPDVDSVWLDGKVAEEMARYKQIKAIGVTEVKQVMFDMGIEHIGDKNREELAKKLGADSFLIVHVRHSGSTPEGVGTGVWTGSTMTMTSFQIAKGGIELSIVSAGDGKVRMKGVGFGETDWKSPKGVLATIVRKIMAEAFETLK